MTALIVDDSRAMRMLLRQALEDLQLDVLEARDGREGLEQLRAHRDIAFALVDWNMPEMTGIELLKAARSEPSLSGVRLIMVTSQSDVNHIQTALAAGADEYVMKPFTDGTIEDKLRLLGLLQETRS